MAKATTDEVANWFIHFAHEVGDPLTNLRLQKLMYYAQAWHLALHEEPLIPDAFEAWVHGPVIPSLFGRFEHYQWNPISETVPKPCLSTEVEEHLLEVEEVYGGLLTWDLERMTHSEDPWVRARQGLARDEPGTKVISEELMKRFHAMRAATAAL